MKKGDMVFIRPSKFLLGITDVNIVDDTVYVPIKAAGATYILAPAENGIARFDTKSYDKQNRRYYHSASECRYYLYETLEDLISTIEFKIEAQELGELLREKFSTLAT